MWPIIETGMSAGTTEAETQAARPAQDSQPVGINHSRGEGGFYARIMFQDEVYPWRYAFIQEHRIFDETEYPSEGDVASKNSWQMLKGDMSQAQSIPGEMSLWNVGHEAPGKPFSTVVATDDNGELESNGIDPGRVLNWADEVNKCQSVPDGSIVWMRGGETYTDPETRTQRDDYTFQWSRPIWARIVGQAVSSSTAIQAPDYAWVELYRERDFEEEKKRKWQDAFNHRASEPHTEGRIIGTLRHPAREVNGNAQVPLNTVVELIPGAIIEYNTDGSPYSQEWLFLYLGVCTPTQLDIDGGINESSSTGGVTANTYEYGDGNALNIAWKDNSRKIVGTSIPAQEAGIVVKPLATFDEYPIEIPEGCWLITLFIACRLKDPDAAADLLEAETFANPPNYRYKIINPCTTNLVDLQHNNQDAIAEIDEWKSILKIRNVWFAANQGRLKDENGDLPGEGGNANGYSSAMQSWFEEEQSNLLNATRPYTQIKVIASLPDDVNAFTDNPGKLHSSCWIRFQRLGPAQAPAEALPT